MNICDLSTRTFELKNNIKIKCFISKGELLFLFLHEKSIITSVLVTFMLL